MAEFAELVAKTPALLADVDALVADVLAADALWDASAALVLAV